MTRARVGAVAVLLVAALAASASTTVWANTREGSPEAVPTVLWGHVVAVVPSRGQLVLAYEDGTSAELRAEPRLLRTIRPGQTVQVVLDGAVVRFVEPVGAPSTLAESGRTSSPG